MNLYVNYTLMSDICGNDSQLDEHDPPDDYSPQLQNRTEMLKGLTVDRIVNLFTHMMYLL